MTCKVQGCADTKIMSGGYCTKHYLRLRRYGDVNFVKCTVGENRNKNPAYRIFAHMFARCTNANVRSYPDYGGRGITICERWKGPAGFTNFILDIGNRPSNKYSLDRIDVNGNYEPTNCRWATHHEQAANKRNNNSDVGISWVKARNKWLVEIKIGKVRHHKRFKTLVEAQVARCNYEAAYLNSF